MNGQVMTDDEQIFTFINPDTGNTFICGFIGGVALHTAFCSTPSRRTMWKEIGKSRLQR
jgi:hypothetical protein